MGIVLKKPRHTRISRYLKIGRVENQNLMAGLICDVKIVNWPTGKIGKTSAGFAERKWKYWDAYRF